MWLLIYLMTVNRLREKASGHLTRSAAGLRSSTARELEGYGGPLFAKDDHRLLAAGGSTPAYETHYKLHAALKQAGLRSSGGGFGVFRGDPEQEVAVAIDETSSMAILDADPSESSSFRHCAVEQMFLQLMDLKLAREMTNCDDARVDADWRYRQLTAANSAAVMSHYTAPCSLPLVADHQPKSSQRGAKRLKGKLETFDQKLQQGSRDYKGKDPLLKSYNGTIEQLLHCIPSLVRLNPSLMQPYSLSSLAALGRLLLQLSGHGASWRLAKRAQPEAKRLARIMRNVGQRLQRELDQEVLASPNPLRLELSGTMTTALTLRPARYRRLQR